MPRQAQCNYCKTVIDVPEGYSRPFIPCPQCKRMATITTPVSPKINAHSKPTFVSEERQVSKRSQENTKSFEYVPHRPEAQLRAPDFSRQQASQMQSGTHSGIQPGALPELMKANKKVAGKPCGICGKSINLVEQIHNCPKCGSVNHDACWTRSGGCIADSCATLQKNAYTPPDIGGLTNATLIASDSPFASQPDMVPCRWCKEPIMRGTRRCKHCNEFQNDIDRENAALSQQIALSESIPLTWSEILGLLCCPLVILVEGIVLVIQGNPKGQRLLLYAAIMLVFNIIVKSLGGKK